MTIYFTYIFSPILIWLFLRFVRIKEEVVSDSFKRLYLIINGILIFLMVGLRHWSLGEVDGRYYYFTWEYISSLDFDTFIKYLVQTDIEKGFLISEFILTRIFHNGQFVFIFSGLIYAISISRFIYRYCREYPYIALVIFNCFGLFNFMVQGIRQGIAIAICLFAVDYCLNRNLSKFILLILLAFLFHASAFVFIFVYLLYGIKLNGKILSISVLIIFIANVFIDKLFGIVSSLLGIVNYLMNETYEYGQTDLTSGGNITIFIYLAMLVLSFVYRPTNTCLNRYQQSSEITHLNSFESKYEFDFFYYLSLVSFITYLMRYSIVTVAVRITFYFMIFYAPIIQKTIQRMGPPINMLANILCCILFLLLAYHKASYSPILPYKFFWQIM